MGTKVQIDSYCLMRDLSRELNDASWPYYGDNNFPNGPFYYGFLQRTTSDSHREYDKDVMKQTMLEHETMSKNRALELHRFHQVHLTDEVRRKDQIKCPIPYEGSSSSSTMPFQLQHENVQRWNGPTLPFANFVINRPITETGTVQPSPHSAKGKSIHAGPSPSPFQNRCGPKNSEFSESRPAKVRRKMLDLQLPAYEYIDLDEVEQCGDVKAVNNTTPVLDKNGKSYLNYPVKTEYGEDKSRSDSQITQCRAFVDLNEPLLHVEETTVSSLRGPTKLSQMSYTEKHKGRTRSIHKGTPYTSSQPTRGLLNHLTCDQIKGDLCKEKYVGNLEKSDENCSLSRYNMPESVLSSHAPNQRRPLYPSDLGKTRDRCCSSNPFLNFSVLSKSHPSSNQSNDLFCNNKWDLNNMPGESSIMRNGFYQGSSSSIEELPGRFRPNGFDYRDKLVPVHDLNLNVPFSNGVSDVQTFESKCNTTDPLAVLPWLRGNNHTLKDKKPERSDFPNSRKIFGVPLFERLLTPKKESPTLIGNSDIDHQSGKEGFESSWRKGGFDMNLPCEVSDSELDTMIVEAIPTEKKTQNESANVRNHFDLNLCVSEEESPCDTGIDLEAPVMVDTDEDVLVEEVHEMPPHRVDNEETELATSVAEVIVAISSSVIQNRSSIEPSGEETLRWFVDVACSSGHDPESHMIVDQRDDNRGLDEYECMVLRLKECNVEEYFPKPTVPPRLLNIDDNGPHVLTTRPPRKGHPRRGRQRRDFQRDILPGLTSLSRHEVTNDLQTYGRLMRDSDHPRDSAPIQRNGTSGRGRRRSVVVAPAPEDTEVVSEDRCLTGWVGKTTRRPRRQRCVAGNPPTSLPLT